MTDAPFCLSIQQVIHFWGVSTFWGYYADVHIVWMQVFDFLGFMPRGRMGNSV